MNWGFSEESLILVPYDKIFGITGKNNGFRFLAKWGLLFFYLIYVVVYDIIIIKIDLFENQSFHIYFSNTESEEFPKKE